MYVMRSRKYTTNGRILFNDTLVEMTTAELHATQFSNDADLIYRKVTAHDAHEWVKKGGIHETGLWVDDDGRIRKAQPGD